MKRALAILFLFTYLSSTTELSELLKFPLLIEHYFEHKATTPDISVREFFALHYQGNHLENHPHDEDYEKDRMLPFMVRADVMTSVFIVNPSLVAFTFSNFTTRKNAGNQAMDDNFPENAFLSSIWQPPQSC